MNNSFASLERYGNALLSAYPIIAQRDTHLHLGVVLCPRVLDMRHERLWGSLARCHERATPSSSRSSTAPIGTSSSIPTTTSTAPSTTTRVAGRRPRRLLVRFRVTVKVRVRLALG